MIVLGIVLLIAGVIPAMDCYPPPVVGPTAPTQSIVITPDNMESLATFIAPGTTIGGRSIEFGPGSSGSVGQKLLEIPLGFIAPHATVRVTTALDPPAKGTDHDPSVGLSDGTHFNDFYITDTGNFVNSAPCRPQYGSHDDNRVKERDSNPAQAVMIFKSIQKYGACYLAMDSGYVNTATFTHQLDLQSGLALTLRRNDVEETYTIYSFIVDIFE